jgi:hemoglobin
MTTQRWSPRAPWLCLAAALSLALGACHPAPAPQSSVVAPPAVHAPAPAPSGVAAATDTTLFARLGGEAGVQAIATGLAARITADGRVSPFFADTDLEAFKANLAKFLGQTCGGPALYHGPDMKTVHTGLGIADAQFDAVIEDLGAVLDQRSVSAADRAALFARLAPLRADIVTR